LLFVTGCTVATNNPNGRSDNSPAIQLETLQFAVTDVDSMEELQRDYEPFRVALENALDTKVEFFLVKNLVAAAPALKSGRVDLVWAGPSEYVVIRARTQAVPVVAVTRPDFRSIIVVRSDSGIDSLADLKDKTIDMYKVGSTSSHIGAVKLLMDAGLDPQSDVNIVMSEKYTLQGLKNGEVDARFIAPHRYEKVLKDEGLSRSDYPIIAGGSLLPSDVLVVSSQLNSEVVEEIRSRLLANQDELIEAILASEAMAKKFKGASLAPASDVDYDMIREVYRAIGQGEFLE